MKASLINDSRHLEKLREQTRSGGQVKYLFFWGHTPTQPDVVCKACFSQWYPAPFELDGHIYRTAEHYMMAAKALLFGDLACRERILKAVHPGEAKRLGRQVRGYVESTWEAHRFQIVCSANLAKFSQRDRMSGFLLSTGSRVLVEASPVDSIWGIGLAADHPNASRPTQWPGLNLLGIALMEVRQQIALRKAISN
ncbi:MAG: DUF1768 domain-containing protein [Ideonella sp. MAG2]|nr:MAG: DUF1768 domain-containing protein [Ideonella sp. MAG2]